MDEIYMVEDDENIRELVLYALKANGFTARGFETAPELFSALAADAPPALILLDVMLPGQDGLSILKQLRQRAQAPAIPVIMLTAKGSEYDKVRGLDMGADDYVTKPFGITELISRIRAVLRRTGQVGTQEQHVHCGGIVLDEQMRSVFANGQEAALTYKEYELLHYLMLHAEMPLSRERLLAQVWGYDYEGETRTVDAHIKSLRHKLGAAGEQIITVRSVGYKITAAI